MRKVRSRHRYRRVLSIDLEVFIDERDARSKSLGKLVLEGGARLVS